MLDARILLLLKVTEAFISYSSHKQVWLPVADVFDANPEDDIVKHDAKLAKDLGRQIIGKLTQ